MARTIVITGITRGIGRGLVEEFDRLGHKIIGCGRSVDQVSELQNALGSDHHFSAVDVTDAATKLEAASVSGAPKKAAPPPAPELLVLILPYGMNGTELAATLETLKTSSKQISSHKRRQLYWEAYGKMIAKTSSLDGAAHCFLTFTALPDGDAADGKVELIELTKRQRGLLNGQCEILGHKLKPSGPDGKPDPLSKSWCVAFSEESAPAAWADLQQGEPCVYVAADGVYVAT